MQFDQEHPRLAHRGGIASRAQGLLMKVLTAVAASVVLIGAVAVSLVVFAIALTLMLAFGLYFWWKLRQARRQAPARFSQGDAIEGVVVRDVRTQERERTRT